MDRTRAGASRKKKKGYKVMMEVVEQEKKKLRSVVRTGRIMTSRRADRKTANIYR